VGTVARLARACRNIVGIKEAGGSADRVSQLRQALGPKFVILSGDDSLTLPFMSVGAQGVVSVASNIIPRQVSRMVSAFAGGRVGEAQRLHAQYYPVFKDLFIETNPVPVKAGLAMLGQIENELRLPLIPASKECVQRLRATLKACKVLK
jgi:4-hydroxy-tetrahydrodipicolinate synthase